MNVLILGCKGQLGSALLDAIPRSVEATGLDLPEIDISDGQAVQETCERLGPDLIVNAAAYTAVDKAESEPELAASANAEAPGQLATIVSALGARLIHISTDFVFDGTSERPYAPHDQANPLGVYGRTKLDGEIAVLDTLPTTSVVIRTAWLYGGTGNNFVNTMLRLMRERDEISVVGDQTGTPTWANSLASIVWAFASQPELSGIYHWTDGGRATWYDFAVAIQQEAVALGQLKRSIPIHRIATEDYPTAAERPKFSVLDCELTCASLGVQQDDWRRNLRSMLKEKKD